MVTGHTLEREWEIKLSGVLECGLNIDRGKPSTKIRELILEKGRRAGDIYIYI